MATEQGSGREYCNERQKAGIGVGLQEERRDRLAGY